MYVQIALQAKSRQRFRSLLSFSTCYFQHSRGVNCIGTSSKDTNDRNREIDFELLFKGCTESELVKRLHALLIVSGKGRSIFISTKLVYIYAHLGDVSSARETFDQVPRKDVYTWNSMVSAYVRNGYFRGAMKCAHEMLSTPEGSIPGLAHLIDCKVFKISLANMLVKNGCSLPPLPRPATTYEKAGPTGADDHDDSTQLYYLNKEDRLLRWLLVKHRDINYGLEFWSEEDSKNELRSFRSNFNDDDDDEYEVKRSETEES